MEVFNWPRCEDIDRREQSPLTRVQKVAGGETKCLYRLLRPRAKMFQIISGGKCSSFGGDLTTPCTRLEIRVVFMVAKGIV